MVSCMKMAFEPEHYILCVETHIIMSGSFADNDKYMFMPTMGRRFSADCFTIRKEMRHGEIRNTVDFRDLTIGRRWAW